MCRPAADDVNPSWEPHTKKNQKEKPERRVCDGLRVATGLPSTDQLVIRQYLPSGFCVCGVPCAVADDDDAAATRVNSGACLLNR